MAAGAFNRILDAFPRHDSVIAFARASCPTPVPIVPGGASMSRISCGQGRIQRCRPGVVRHDRGSSAHSPGAPFGAVRTGKRSQGEQGGPSGRRECPWSSSRLPRRQCQGHGERSRRTDGQWHGVVTVSFRPLGVVIDAILGVRYGKGEVVAGHHSVHRE